MPRRGAATVTRAGRRTLACGAGCPETPGPAYSSLSVVADGLREVWRKPSQGSGSSPRGTTHVEALQVVNEWVGTRYIDDALASLQERQAQEQEIQQRRRGGLGLDF